MSKEQMSEILRAGKARIGEELDSLIKEIDEGTSDPDHFMSISDIERLWSQRMANTYKIYSDTISDMIRSKRESEPENREKENLPEKDGSQIEE